MKRLATLVSAISVLLAICGPAAAQAPAGTGSSQTSLTHDLLQFGETVFGLFQKQPHPTLQPVAPGGGPTGGIGFSPAPWKAGHLFTSMRSSVSAKKYWATDVSLWWQQANHFRLEGYGRAREMPQLPFFGVGGDSTLNGETDFRLLERAVGLTGWFRPQSQQWIGVGGRAEQLWPNVGPGKNGTVMSIEQRFSDTTAPGRAAQPTFTHLQGFVNINYPAGRNEQARRGGNYEVAYGLFSDRTAGQFSFRRLDVELQQRFTVFGRDRRLTLHALSSLSDVDAGQRVPFYLMQTLGGADNLRGFHEDLIGGDETTATLRGFRDFRFRGANVLLVQAEYRFNVLGPVDITIFGDAGRVADRRRDLFNHLKHDVGLSVSLMRVNATVIRFDFAFGGGEGTQNFFTVGRVIAP